MNNEIKILTVTPEVNSHIVVVNNRYRPYRRDEHGQWTIEGVNALDGGTLTCYGAEELEKAFQEHDTPPTKYEASILTLRNILASPEDAQLLAFTALNWIDDEPIPLGEE